MKEISKKTKLSNNSEIILETGLLAQFADGAVLVRQGNAMLLATVVSKKEAKEGIDFLPLSVVYQEQFAGSGKIPGGFLKREGRPSEHEILISRLVDRALRPLFPVHYPYETQIIITLLSADENIMPDALACLAASAAILISDIPFEGPVAEVRIARINQNWEINPGFSELNLADIDLMVAGTVDDIVMVEGKMKEVSETEMLEAIKEAHKWIKKLCWVQFKLLGESGIIEKRNISEPVKDTDLRSMLYEWCTPRLDNVLVDPHKTRVEKLGWIDELKDFFVGELSQEQYAEKKLSVEYYFKEFKKESLRNAIIDEGIRLDGRKVDEIRPINIRLGYLPSAHGSALFIRGETQALASVTLGGKKDEQLIEGVSYEEKNRFMLHYNFPPFCTGEVKHLTGTSRREIGHGELARRSLLQVLPTLDDCPYTIRIVSDILQANGSSSMATVCAASLALMDAGVKIKEAVAGIAMGLIKHGDKYVVLSDILGDEDHIGDMDFKITGTKNGITGCQMDIKVKGLPYKVLIKALEQARKGRNNIIDRMNEAISEPNPFYKSHVPMIERVLIPKEYIGVVIGAGGKVIQDLQKVTKSIIVVEEENESGVVEISGGNREGIAKAKALILELTQIPLAGVVYEGKVKSIMDHGAFIEILPGKQGLLRISELAWGKIENISDHISVGETINVKVLEIDKRSGKLKLSRKVLIEKPENSIENNDDQRQKQN